MAFVRVILVRWKLVTIFSVGDNCYIQSIVTKWFFPIINKFHRVPNLMMIFKKSKVGVYSATAVYSHASYAVVWEVKKSLESIEVIFICFVK